MRAVCVADDRSSLSDCAGRVRNCVAHRLDSRFPSDRGGFCLVRVGATTVGHHLRHIFQYITDAQCARRRKIVTLRCVVHDGVPPQEVWLPCVERKRAIRLLPISQRRRAVFLRLLPAPGSVSPILLRVVRALRLYWAVLVRVPLRPHSALRLPAKRARRLLVVLAILVQTARDAAVDDLLC